MNRFFNDEDLEKSGREIETYNSIEELKYSEENDSDQTNVISLDDLNEKELNDPRDQALLKQSQHKNISIFIFS